MKRLVQSIMLLALVAPGVPVFAEDDQTIAYFYPLRTRRPSSSESSSSASSTKRGATNA